MLKKSLITSLICLGGLLNSSAAPTIGGPTLSSSSGTSSGVDTNAVIALIEEYAGGGSSLVSNQIELSFTVDVWRTNNSSQIWVVDSTITATPGGGNGFCQWEVDTNLNGTADWDSKRSGVNGGTDVVHGTLGGIVLPGWAFRYFNNSVGGSASPEAGTGSIYYYSTNSSSGGGGGVSTAAVVAIMATNNAAGATNQYGKAVVWHNNVGTSYSTLSNAQAAAVAGDLIQVYPGIYSASDLGKNQVNWHFESGAVVNHDGGGVSESIFTDNAVEWFSGTFAQGTNSITNAITGNLTATNLTAALFRYGGPLSRVTFEAEKISGTNRTHNVMVCLVNNYDYPAAAAYMQPQLSLRADTIANSTIYASEFAGTYDVRQYTNVWFYVDRDSNKAYDDLVFNGSDALNCNMFVARPAASRVVFNIGYFSAGASFTAAEKTINGFGLFWNSEAIFNGTTFLQHTNNTAAFELSGVGDSFAYLDYTNSGHIKFNNCSVIGYSGATNNLFTVLPNAASNSPTIAVIGQLAYINAAGIGSITNSGPGSIVLTPGLTNRYTPFIPLRTVTTNANPQLGTLYTNTGKLGWFTTSLKFAPAAGAQRVRGVTYRQGNTSTNFWAQVAFDDAGSTYGVTEHQVWIPLNPFDVFYLQSMNDSGVEIVTNTWKIVNEP